MNDLRKELGLTYLFISHNLAVVDYVAEEIGVMCKGRIVEIAPREVLFRNPIHPYTRGLLAAVPYPDLNRRLDLATVLEGAARDPRNGPHRSRGPKVMRANCTISATATGFARRPAPTLREQRHDLAPSVLAALAAIVILGSPAGRAQNTEPPLLADAVKSAKLPPMAERLPTEPLTVPFDRVNRKLGKYGGDLRMLMAKDRDIRMMVVYGYARLVGYDQNLRFIPDILASYENVGDREFTLRLRAGHRWSDGAPFTTEDFRYYWEDIANNKSLSPLGLPQALLANRQGPASNLSRRAHDPVRLGRSQPAVPARPRRAFAVVPVPSGALPQEIPREVSRG